MTKLHIERCCKTLPAFMKETQCERKDFHLKQLQLKDKCCHWDGFGLVMHLLQMTHANLKKEIVMENLHMLPQTKSLHYSCISIY